MIEQEHGIILDLIHFENHANHAILVLRDAHIFQKAAGFDFDLLIEKRAIDVGVIEIEIDSIGTRNARGLIFHRPAKVDYDSCVGVGIPSLNACDFGDFV